MPDVFMYAGQKYRCEDTNNRPSLFTILKPGNGITDRYPPGTAAIYNLMGLAVMFYEQVRFIISLLVMVLLPPDSRSMLRTRSVRWLRMLPL